MDTLPLRKIRRQLGRIERAARELRRIQDSIPIPSAEELNAMTSGTEPFSPEAYVLGVLKHAELRLEEETLNLRGHLHKVNFTDPARRNRWGMEIDLGRLIEAVRFVRED